MSSSSVDSRRQRVLIMGAAGRDFHNFNLVFRDDARYEVVAFTAAQIPNIEDRTYPPQLAGDLYPAGIRIYPEQHLEGLIREHSVAHVVFAYSDVSHSQVMHVASRALAAGADFWLLGPRATTLQSTRPVLAVCAVRTGAGKSQTSRYVAQIVSDMGLSLVVIRHPMAYAAQLKGVQRFASSHDLAAAGVTVEEREEYEPHLARGNIVYAGVDYQRILGQAERESQVVLWEGGNNDFPFIQPDLLMVVADPLRAGDELEYHPGETNLRMADVVVINKVDSAAPDDIQRVRDNVYAVNPGATVVEAASPIAVDDSDAIRGKSVLVVEDGPSVTHGEMAFGAAYVAARRFGAAQVIDPRPYAVGSIADTLAAYPDTGPVLPAIGYGEQQLRELEATINRTPADLVLIGTPIDLARLVKAEKPMQRVRYDLQVIGEPSLAEIIRQHLSAVPVEAGGRV